ncbi:MAG: hydrogenase maturation nickel metallochaperone HypA [bacterium]
MHEFGLAESALALALDHAQKKGARKIIEVRMQIGALTGVVEEAFEFAFDALAENTMAAGAELVIEHVPIVCYCCRCECEFETNAYAYQCPDCGEASTEVRRGRELNLVSMEVS